MTTTPPSAASTYQQLRAHLATLKLTIAAEQLPAVLDAATAEGLSRPRPWSGCSPPRSRPLRPAAWPGG